MASCLWAASILTSFYLEVGGPKTCKYAEVRGLLTVGYVDLFFLAYAQFEVL